MICGYPVCVQNQLHNSTIKLSTGVQNRIKDSVQYMCRCVQNQIHNSTIKNRWTEPVIWEYNTWRRSWRPRAPWWRQWRRSRAGSRPGTPPRRSRCTCALEMETSIEIKKKTEDYSTCECFAKIEMSPIRIIILVFQTPILDSFVTRASHDQSGFQNTDTGHVTETWI